MASTTLVVCEENDIYIHISPNCVGLDLNHKNKKHRPVFHPEFTLVHLVAHDDSFSTPELFIRLLGVHDRNWDILYLISAINQQLR